MGTFPHVNEYGCKDTYFCVYIVNFYIQCYYHKFLTEIVNKNYYFRTA